MEKIVKFRDLCIEMNRLQMKYDGYNWDITLCDLNDRGLDSKPIQLGVSWTSYGLVSSEEAESFMSAMNEAIKDCKNFKYNGYFIDWS